MSFTNNNQNTASQENQSSSSDLFKNTEQSYGDDRYDGLLDLIGFEESNKPQTNFRVSSGSSLLNNLFEKGI